MGDFRRLQRPLGLPFRTQSLAALIADPVRGQDTTLQEATLLET